MIPKVVVTSVCTDYLFVAFSSKQMPVHYLVPSPNVISFKPSDISKIYKMLSDLSYNAPTGSSSMRLLRNAYLALMVEFATPPSEGFPPCFKELRPLRRKVKEFPSRSQFFFPSIPIASLVNSRCNWGTSPVRNTIKQGS